MKKNKKKRTPTKKLLAKLSPAEKKARTKKLKYVTLKTKLEKAGLWKTYLKAKKEGGAKRGGSVALMESVAGGEPVFDSKAEKEATETISKTVDAFVQKNSDKPSLVSLAQRLEALDKERAAVASRLRELLG